MNEYAIPGIKAREGVRLGVLFRVLDGAQAVLRVRYFDGAFLRVVSPVQLMVLRALVGNGALVEGGTL